MTNFTFRPNPTLTLVCMSEDAPVNFSLEAASQLTGVHPEMIRYYYRAGLVGALEAMSDTELYFDETSLREIRRIEHYRRHLGVGRSALPLVCELRRQAELQHIELRFLSSV